MKTTFIYLSIPLAVACTQNQKTTGPVKTSSTQTGEPTRIIGVVNYEEKCSFNKAETKCLTIKGGDDLNDKQLFVLNQSENGFEVLDDKTSPKTFRIWTKDKERSVDVFENEHISVLAHLLDRTPEELTTIKGVESIARLEK